MDDRAHLDPPAPLAAILARTDALAFPMPSEPRTGALLRTLAASKPGGQLLELGTGTGLSTAWLLDGMDSTATLITVDSDPTAQQIARDVLGRHPRLTIVTEDGAAFLHAQKPESFDLIFADTWPGKFDHLDDALALLKPGGLYVIDDMLPQDNWPEHHAPKVPALIATLAAKPGFRMVGMAWSSGIVVLARSDLNSS